MIISDPSVGNCPLIIFERIVEENDYDTRIISADSLYNGFVLNFGDIINVERSNCKFYISYGGGVPIEVTTYKDIFNREGGYTYIQSGIWQVDAIETGTENGINFFKLYLVRYEGEGLCQHSYEWQVEVEPTGEADGVEAYRCTKCNHVSAYNKIPNTSKKINEVLDILEKATDGETVTIQTNYFKCFNQTIMKKIADMRNNIIIIQYKEKDHKYQITIPAEAKVPTDVEYAGFDQYLAGIYGKEEIQ